MSAVGPGRDAAPARATALSRPRAAEAGAVCCLVAAAIHLAVFPDHATEWWAYGAFFAGCAVWQTVLGLLLWSGPRPRWLLLAGLASLLAVLVLYVLSRTNGAPLGPHAHVIEPVGTVDLATARTLVDSMTTEVVVRDDAITRLVPGAPLGYDDAVRLALADRKRAAAEDRVREAQ